MKIVRQRIGAERPGQGSDLNAVGSEALQGSVEPSQSVALTRGASLDFKFIGHVEHDPD